MRVAPFVLYRPTLTAQTPTLDKDSALAKTLAEEVSRTTTPVNDAQLRFRQIQLPPRRCLVQV